MIRLFGGGSPNAMKIVLMLEELALPYTLIRVKALRGEQFSPEFLKLNPIAKYPVIVDEEGAGPDQPIFESGAILIYLAETYGQQFLARSGEERWETLKWLIAQVAWVGPMLGQHNHFLLHETERGSYASARYRQQAERVYHVLDDRLKDRPFLAGDRYTIADIATYAWGGYVARHGFKLTDYPSLARWSAQIAQRPAAQRTAKVNAEIVASFHEESPRGPEDVNRFFGRIDGPPATFSALIDPD